MSPEDDWGHVNDRAQLNDRAHVLVMAKAPIAGRVKTRLGREIGKDVAAELAAASLLDTIDACAAYAPGRCFLALDGQLANAVRGLELAERLASWTTFAQIGISFPERLANAHAAVPGPVVQVGMDTPQATTGDLEDVVAGLTANDAVLAPAEDGGWWALALRNPASGDVLRGVPMSTPDTYRDTHAALRSAGLSVGTSTILRDVDTLADADAVAGLTTGAFSRAWSRHRKGARA